MNYPLAFAANSLVGVAASRLLGRTPVESLLVGVALGAAVTVGLYVSE